MSSAAAAEHPAAIYGDLPDAKHAWAVHDWNRPKPSRVAVDAKKRTGYAIYKKALERGLVLRPLGDILYFNPPLNITREELSTAIELAHESITDILPE